MASRLGRSLYRFSSVSRPVPPPGTTSTQESAQSEGRQLPSVTKEYQPAGEQTSPKRARSPPYSSTRESVPSSPTYSVKKSASPPSSPTYRPAASHTISSPTKPAAESPKYKQTTQPRSPPEVEQKPIIYKTVERPAKSDRHLDSGKSPHKQPNAIKIAGENLGAVMEIVQSPSKREGGQVIRKKETRGTHNISNENDDQKRKETTSSPANTFLNSNFQTVNNSLVYNATLNQQDPGLHLVFSRKPTGDRFTIDDDKKHIKS